ncbi:copper resistance protein B [Acinetobacter sp. ANC 5383]
MHITKFLPSVLLMAGFAGQPLWAATDMDMTAASDSSISMQMQHEHGGQVYAANSLENKWVVDRHGAGSWQSELESWIGSDDNKLFIKADGKQAESEQLDANVMALYSCNISTFWDAQAGLRYRQNNNLVADKHAVDVVVGIHGLAPYFFETQAYLYVGEHQHVSMSLEARRDLLWTQKLISEPFVKATVLLRDNSKAAQKTGLSHAEVGVQTRYEINKTVMPFFEVAYESDLGQKATAWQQLTPNEYGVVYALGVLLKF